MSCQNGKSGSLLGGILLIGGSCIGAGMLALPVITGIGGFIPAICMFVVAWLFMTITGLLLLEANLSLGFDLNLISIAERTLGSVGKVTCWVLFLFLFYSLSVAYIAASGAILNSIVFDFFGLSLPSWSNSTFFTFTFGLVLFFGTRSVDYLNRLLMLGLFVAYFALIFLSVPHINIDYLMVSNWRYSFAALPILIISFGYQNMIPSMASYFKGDVKRLKLAVVLGSFLPLLFYLLWEAVMLGILPVTGRDSLLSALDQGLAATEVLRSVVGHSAIGISAQAFGLFAIITSFLAQSLSLVSFLGDGLRISSAKGGRLFLILLTLIPPFILAFIYPGIFIKALNIAGGFSAVILFGILPVLMIWKLRYQTKLSLSPVIPVNKPILILIFCVAVSIFALELVQELGFSLLPQSVEVEP